MQVAGLLQKEPFDRQPVVFDETVAADELEIGVHMHQLEACALKSEGMEDAWMPDAGAGPRQLEAIFKQCCVEELGISLVDEEIDIICRCKRLLEAYIAFPMT